MADKPTKFDAKAHVEASKKEWLRKQEALKNQLWRKSKYPPMAIEPFPHERQRLPFQMSAEDRALRQQWLKDQHLSPTEPRYVPELRPRNVFRRTLGLPWDILTKAVTPAIGIDKARYVRWLGPKVGIYFATLFVVFDYFAHHTKHWEMSRGWNMMSNKLPIYPVKGHWSDVACLDWAPVSTQSCMPLRKNFVIAFGVVVGTGKMCSPILGEPLPDNPQRDYHEKHRGDFYDLGFSQRKTHLNPDISSHA